jgi:DNA-binding CsgD family transcriptional regulator
MTTKLNVNHIHEIYAKLLERQKFVADDLDYSILERHKPNLQKLAETSNSTISVFDFYKQTHVFNSSNLGSALGYSPQDIETGGEHFLDAKIHPEDYAMLILIAINGLKFFFNSSPDRKLNCKLISEYRILNAAGNYVRVIEQQQILELDAYENPWLTLSIFDISPNQKNMDEGLKSEMVNFRTGRIIPFIEPETETANSLTKRETEILKLVKDGFLSKEISDKLTISLHTVNTHRQRVLEKLGVDNSMEAVMLASKLGLI